MLQSVLTHPRMQESVTLGQSLEVAFSLYIRSRGGAPVLRRLHAQAAAGPGLPIPRGAAAGFVRASIAPRAAPYAAPKSLLARCL